MNKTQFIEKCRKEFRDKYVVRSCTGHYPKCNGCIDIVRNVDEAENFLQSKLSECWDMAEEALEPKLAKLLLPEAMSDNDERNKTFAFGYNSASKEVNKKIRTLIDSLTSKQEDRP